MEKEAFCERVLGLVPAPNSALQLLHGRRVALPHEPGRNGVEMRMVADIGRALGRDKIVVRHLVLEPGHNLADANGRRVDLWRPIWSRCANLKGRQLPGYEGHGGSL